MLLSYGSRHVSRCLLLTPAYDISDLCPTGRSRIIGRNMHFGVGKPCRLQRARQNAATYSVGTASGSGILPGVFYGVFQHEVLWPEVKDMKGIICILLLALGGMTASAAKAAVQAGSCAPSAGLNFICGMQAPEDLVLVPNTRWLIASGMVAGSGLHLIDTQAKTARSLFGPAVSTSREDKTKFSSCPGSLDPKQAILHGLVCVRPRAADTRCMRRTMGAANPSRSGSPRAGSEAPHCAGEARAGAGQGSARRRACAQ